MQYTILHHYAVLNLMVLGYCHGSFRQLERGQLFDDKVCAPANSLFEEFTSSLLLCCGLCHVSGTCVSLFYNGLNNTCYGCSEAYVDASRLDGQVGTKYVYDPSRVPTTSTSTTSTSTSTSSSTTTKTTTPPPPPTTTTTPRMETSPAVMEGWEYFEGSYYRLETNLQAYLFAQMDCASKGANLVHISSEAENTFVGQMLKTALGDKYKVYIGASDLGTEGTWVWDDDHSALDYHKWRGGSAHVTPDQDCGAIVADTNGDFEWMDVYCYMGRSYVCEQ